MTKKNLDQARNLDKKHFKRLWEAAVAMIKENYIVKSEKTDEIFIHAKNIEDFDIEITFDGPPAIYYFHVNLWNIKNGYSSVKNTECNSLLEMFMVIDEYLDEIKAISKYGPRNS